MCVCMRSVLQSVAVCCRVLQCVAVCCRVLQSVAECCRVLQSVAACYSVSQCIAVCYIVLQCVAVHRSCARTARLRKRMRAYVVWCSLLRCVTHCCSGLVCSVWQCISVFGSVFFFFCVCVQPDILSVCVYVWCATVCCSVSQCVTVCHSVLPCSALWCSVLHCVTLCCSVLQYSFPFSFWSEACYGP